MDSLTRWSPLEDAMTLRDAVSRLFEDSIVTPNRSRTTGFGIETDIHENENAYTVEATVPGLNAEDLDITFHNNILTIQGEIHKKEQNEGTTTHRTERRYGRFTRSFSLPMAIDTDAIEANLEQGILTLTLPKAEVAKPRKINIQGNNTQQKTLEAGK